MTQEDSNDTVQLAIEEEHIPHIIPMIHKHNLLRKAWLEIGSDGNPVLTVVREKREEVERLLLKIDRFTS